MRNCTKRKWHIPTVNSNHYTDCMIDWVTLKFALAPLHESLFRIKMQYFQSMHWVIPQNCLSARLAIVSTVLYLSFAHLAFDQKSELIPIRIIDCHDKMEIRRSFRVCRLNGMQPISPGQQQCINHHPPNDNKWFIISHSQNWTIN